MPAVGMRGCCLIKVSASSTVFFDPAAISWAAIKLVFPTDSSEIKMKQYFDLMVA